MTSAAPLALTAVLGAGLIAATAALSQTPPAAAPDAAAAQAAAQNARGTVLFTERCTSCHEPAIEGAPNRSDLAAMDPEFTYGVLKSGEMAPMAKGLSDEDLRALSKFLTTY